MNITRIAAFVAAPAAALLLSACGGGSSGIVGGGGGALGQNANVRFVQGLPAVPGSATPNVDVYFQSNGSAAPTSPLISAVPYGQATTYVNLPAVAGSVIVQRAGAGAPSTGTAALTSCPVPQFANNANYSIVLVTAGGVVNCAIFQDAVYTGGSQYRFHNASPNAGLGTTVAYGAATAPAGPGSPFAVQGQATFGILSAGTSSAVTYTQTPATTLGTTTNVSFAVGPNAASGATGVATNTLDASKLMLPSSATQPNATNTFTLPSGFAGASIYQIDCSAGVTVPAGSTCVAGSTLVGVFDNH